MTSRENKNKGLEALNIAWNHALRDDMNAATRNRILRGLGQVYLWRRDVERFQKGANAVLTRKMSTNVLRVSRRLDEVRKAIRDGGDASKISANNVSQRLPGLPVPAAEAEMQARVVTVLLDAGAAENVGALGPGHISVSRPQLFAIDNYIRSGHVVFLKLLKALLRRGYPPLQEFQRLERFPRSNWNVQRIDRWLDTHDVYDEFYPQTSTWLPQRYFQEADKQHGRPLVRHVRRLLDAGGVLNEFAYYRFLHGAKRHSAEPNTGLDRGILKMFQAADLTYYTYPTVAPSLTAGQRAVLHAYGLTPRPSNTRSNTRSRKRKATAAPQL